MLKELLLSLIYKYTFFIDDKQALKKGRSKKRKSQEGGKVFVIAKCHLVKTLSSRAKKSIEVMIRIRIRRRNIVENIIHRSVYIGHGGNYICAGNFSKQKNNDLKSCS